MYWFFNLFLMGLVTVATPGGGQIQTYDKDHIDSLKSVAISARDHAHGNERSIRDLTQDVKNQVSDAEGRMNERMDAVQKSLDAMPESLTAHIREEVLGAIGELREELAALKAQVEELKAEEPNP